jgi:hypothetical protein
MIARAARRNSRDPATPVSKRGLGIRRAALHAGLLLAALLSPALAQAQQFQFAPAPQTDLNRVYRVDRVTGEVGACQYGLQEGSIGVTLCFPAGEGAGKQEPSDYALVPSRHEREGGIFRVDQRNGAMSICYVFDDKVVCTPPERGAPPQKAATPGAAEGAGSASPSAPRRP